MGGMAEDDVEDAGAEFIEFKCPYCGGEVSFPAEDAGAVQGCPFCPQVFVVPFQNGAPGRPVPVPISLPKLALRRLGPEDNGDLAGFMNDPELVRYLSAEAMDEQGIADWLARDQSLPMLQPGQPLWLGVEFSGKIIGLASVTYDRESPGAPPDRQVAISVCINPACQRKGFGLETVRGLLAFSFNDINIRRVTASCDSRNAAAKGLLTKAGLRFEGEFFQNSFVKNEWADTCYFAMLAGEYKAK